MPTTLAMSDRIELATARGRFAALEVGPRAGRPVIYLHGFPDHPPTASPFLHELAARGYRVLAPWLRGYLPTAVGGPYDVDTLAGDPVALAEAWLGAGARFDLVGHDWGAVIAYATCAAHGDRVHRAVTLAMPHPVTFLRRVRTPAQARRSWYMALFQLPGAGHALRLGLLDRLWRTWSPGFTLPSAARDELHAWLAQSLPGPIAYYRAIAWPPAAALARVRRAAREQIAVPVLALHGADDGCVAPPPEDDARYFAAAYEREILPGRGHFLQHEAPAEIAARAAAWLAR